MLNLKKYLKKKKKERPSFSTSINIILFTKYKIRKVFFDLEYLIVKMWWQTLPSTSIYICLAIYIVYTCNYKIIFAVLWTLDLFFTEQKRSSFTRQNSVYRHMLVPYCSDEHACLSSRVQGSIPTYLSYPHAENVTCRTRKVTP